MVLGQNRAVLVASMMCFQKIYGLHDLNHQIIEYWVSKGRYWLEPGGTGSEQVGTGCQHDKLSENIWFTWSKSSNYWMFEEGKSDYGQTNKQTDRISSCRLNPFCRRGRVKMDWLDPPKQNTLPRVNFGHLLLQAYLWNWYYTYLYICKAGMQTTSYKLQRLLVLVGLLIIGLPKSQD